MKEYIVHDEWKIIEDQFRPEFNRISESLFSIGNGWMGQRANFEEDYSGDTFQGSYIAGVYYPDKTRVGWWKNGYPEYFAKVLNSVNWIGIHIFIDNDPLDLSRWEVLDFSRTLDMKSGLLIRNVHLAKDGKEVKIHTKRFCSMETGELGVLSYEVLPVNFDGQLRAIPYLDFDVVNEDSNYDEKFWDEIDKASGSTPALLSGTKKLDFQVSAAMAYDWFQNGTPVSVSVSEIIREKYVGYEANLPLKQGETTTINKYVGVCSSLNHKKSDLILHAQKVARRLKAKAC